MILSVSGDKKYSIHRKEEKKVVIRTDAKKTNRTVKV